MNVAIRNDPKVLSREGTGGSKAKGLSGAAVGAAVGRADMMAPCVLAASTLKGACYIARSTLSER